MTSTAGRSIWNWRERSVDAERARALARLRREGLLQGFVTLGLGVVMRHLLGHVTLGNVLVLLGALQALVGLWRPLWLRPVRRLTRGFGRGVGLVLTWLLLVPLFVIVVVPSALVVRLRGLDPLQRRPLAPGLTAWIPRRRGATSESCARQFIEEDRAARTLGRAEGAGVEPALLAELEAPR